MSTTTNNDIRKDDDNDETPWYLVRPSSFNTTTTIHIDGRTGEGGGQILRNAMAYATLLQHPDVHINHIRGGRSKPGLQAQHVASIQLPVELTALESSQQRRNPSIENSNNNDDATAVLTGDTVGSMEIRYRPLSTNTTKAIEEEESTTHNPDQGTSPSSPWIVEKDIGTAGSICLLLQASLPSALLVARHRPVQLILKGGTNATFAPQYDYWQYVFLPMLQHCCRVSPHHIRGHVVRRGYFPRGGGIVDVHVQPLVSALPAFDLTHRGTRLASLYIRAFHAGRIPRRVAHDMAAAAKMCLQQQHSSLGQSMMIRDETNKEDDNNTQCNLQVDIVTETNAVGNGWGILIVATTDTGCKLAGSALGSTTRSRNNHSPTRAQAQTVGRSAAHELITAWDAGGCVDEWLQDQLIIFMALAEGESKMLTGCLTLHTQTAIWTAQQLCPGVHFQVTKLPTTANEMYSHRGNQNDDEATTSNRHHPKHQSSRTVGDDPPPITSHPAPKKPKNHERPSPSATAYGQKGLIPGRHLITCRGIGLQPR